MLKFVPDPIENEIQHRLMKVAREYPLPDNWKEIYKDIYEDYKSAKIFSEAEIRSMIIWKLIEWEDIRSEIRDQVNLEVYGLDVGWSPLD